MKLLLLADSLPNGGAERQLALLANNLPRDWQTHVCALGGGPFEADLRAKGVAVEVHERRFRLDPVPVAALSRRLLTMRPDVVHSWGWISTLAAGPLCRLSRVPLIDGTIRSGALQPQHLWLKRSGMACATLIVANTRAGLQAWGAHSAKARVVYNGFDWSRLEGEGVAAEPEPVQEAKQKQQFTAVMLGRMVPAKDYAAVIACARLLRRERQTCKFLLVGDGPQRDNLFAQASSLIADGIVSFPVPSIEVVDHVRQAHVGVLMTDPRWHQEGCSNAIMEYMACGLPVVCSEGGGNRELVVDGVTGFVIPPGDPQALAERIAYLRDHDPERQAMGAAGRQRILQDFSVERMVDGFLHVYEEALQSGLRRSRRH
jgi:glycosyltransferase involved in cell wall biosynthesis